MSLLEAILLAIVQAVTEFLPISSTAHLFLIPWALGMPDPGITFTVAVHAGTLLAVLLYFFRTWAELALAGIGIHYPRAATAEQVAGNRRLFWLIVAGTIPAALAGYFLERTVETTFRSPYLMGTMLILVSGLMWLGDRHGTRIRGLMAITLPDSLIIGASQAAALIPGVSRSGATITAGLFRGLSREAAARFTFLLSTPIIGGAAGVKFLELRQQELLPGEMQILLISALVSAVVGYLVIAFLIRYLQTRTLQIFIVYRVVFGILILLLAFSGVGPAK